jgi:hypothetical protein
VHSPRRASRSRSCYSSTTPRSTGRSIGITARGSGRGPPSERRRRAAPGRAAAGHRSGAAIAAMPAADSVSPHRQRTPARWMRARRALLRLRRGARAGPHGPPTGAAGRGRAPTKWAGAIAACADERGRAPAPHARRLPVPCAQPAAHRPTIWPRRALSKKTGGVLLSQALASQVPSALRGLTSLFGMGRGVSPSLKPPKRARPASPVLQNCTAPQGIRDQKIRQALDPLVPVSFRRYRPSRSGLSTWWSTRGLTPSRGWENSS